MRRRRLAFVVTFVVVVSGIGTAGVLAAARSPSAAPPAGQEGDANEQDGGVHGGLIERFHKAGSCDLTPTSSLAGNWTHGDYVTAVAAGGDPDGEIREAAHSDCGKPMVAVGHGGGPPSHAHAGGNANGASSDSSGS